MQVFSPAYCVSCLKYDVCIQAEVLHIGTIWCLIPLDLTSLVFNLLDTFYIGAVKIPEDLTEVVEG